MSDAPTTETIRIIGRAVRRRAVDGGLLEHGDEGEVLADAASALVWRDDAEWAGASRCQETTGDGGRCSRKAGENGYCYQHPPEDS